MPLNYIPYSIDDVKQHLKVKEYKSNQGIERKGYACGFQYWGPFLKLQNGWHTSYEDISPNCVRVIISKYGSREEKMFFNNAVNDDTHKSELIPITPKEIARDRKRLKRAKKEYWKHRTKKIDYRKVISEHNENIYCVSQNKAKEIYYRKYAYVKAS